MDTEQFEERKKAHIQHSLDSENQALGQSDLDEIHLFHEALPEFNFDEVSLSSKSLGHAVTTPFYVSGMTAGHADAPLLNRTLGIACQARGWAMGVGSQRRDLEMGHTLDHWKSLRKEVQKLVLFANIGISQLITAPVSKIGQLVTELEAQALAIHLNALQEVIQPEGTPQFKGGLHAIERICRELKVPVIIKETGCGFSSSTLKRLGNSGVTAIDVSGLGGTHWGRIEGARAKPKSVHALTSRTFANWGESTAHSVQAACSVLPKSVEIWGSGGVRSGLDAAKLIALGAHQIGYAKPALEMALQGPEFLNHWMEQQEYELKVALFCTGSLTPNALRSKEKSWVKI